MPFGEWLRIIGASYFYIMAKDPAFLFYPNDFTVGTQFFSNEQVGIYVRILCAQHQHGHLSKSQIQRLCNGISNSDDLEEVLNKFKQDSEGKYYNERLDDEILKRRKHSDKQRENAKMRWHKTGNANAMPLENENENVIENIITNKIVKKEKTIFSDFLEKQCPTVLKLKTQLTQDQAEKLNAEFGFAAVCEILEAMENWIPLTKKSKSVYLTAKTWLNKRKETDGTKKLTYTDHAKQWFDATSKNSILGGSDQSTGGVWDS